MGLHKKQKQIFMLLALLTVVSIALFLTVGLQGNIMYALTKRSERLLAIMLSGTSIATATVLFQTVVQNRILTPNVLGLDSLYMLFQTTLVFIFGSIQLVHLPQEVNFIVSVSLMICFSGTLFRILFKQNRNIYLLLLVGIVVGTFFQSLTSFMQMMLDPNEFLLVQDKSFASFTNIGMDVFGISLILFVIACILIYRVWNTLDVLTLGREHAINLGVNYEKIVKQVLIVVIILIALSTALVGPLTFLGLLVVNLTYQLFSTYKHRILIPASIVMSIVILVSGQFIVERVFTLGVPLSVIINFIGGSYFIYLLWKGNKQ
ncbi:MAG: iron chelate uptake ABC transporter family permease subunit [Culicoidibacterales bacterium]